MLAFLAFFRAGPDGDPGVVAPVSAAFRVRVSAGDGDRVDTGTGLWTARVGDGVP